MGTQNARFYSGAGAGSAIAFFLAALSFSPKAGAVIINPGQTETPTGTETVSGSVADSLPSIPFAGTNASSIVVFTGTISSQAVLDSSTGDYDFLYQFTNNPNSLDTIEHLTVGGYTGFTTDADYLAGTNVAPTPVTRSASGDNIGFEFLASNAVPQGATTDVLFVKTDATSYTIGNAVVQDGGNGSVAVIVPNTVPEPATASLICVSAGALCLRRRRKA
jgi:hypothetical protein